MGQHAEDDRSKFNLLLKVLDNKISPGCSKEEVCFHVAQLVAAKLLATLRVARVDSSSYLKDQILNLGFTQTVANAIVSQLNAVIKNVPEEYPSDISAYPQHVDLAASFLDVRLPKDERKGIGFYCTTPPIISQLVEELNVSKYDGIPSLVDHSAGSGALSLAVLDDYRKSWSHTVSKRWEIIRQICQSWLIVEREQYMAAIVTMQFLMLLLKEQRNRYFKINRWPVKEMDAFADHSRNRFSHAIGNPPYIGEKQARDSIASALALYPDLQRAYGGKADLSFLFLLHGIFSLKKGGRLAYLTPAYWPTADGAKSLRQSMLGEASVNSLNEPDAKIYSANGVRVVVVSLTKRHQRLEGQMEENRAWSIGESDRQSAILDKMESSGVGLCSKLGPVEIKAGIQSGVDKLTTAHLKYLENDFKPNVGSGVYLLSYDEHKSLANKLTDDELKLVKPFCKSPACGPFLFDETPSGWMIYLNGSVEIELLPNIKKHLLPFKSLLLRRRECQQGKIPWWRLHWPREENIFTSESILVPQRANAPRFAYAENGSFSSVDVYHLLPRENVQMTLMAVLAMLHSMPVRFWLKMRGKRKGALFELYSTPLKKLPIPVIASQYKIKQLELISKKMLLLMDEIKQQSIIKKSLYLQLADMRKQGAPVCLEIDKLQLQLDELIMDELNFNQDERDEIKTGSQL